MNYTNPIIKGFNPDPSICRVGGDYYLVTSSFEYFPGIPVYHSRDLVNWEMIGHCIDRAEQLPMECAKPSGGIWAPTIRFDGGTFYVTASFDGKGNFIVKSQNPAGGWSDAVWCGMDGLDPSMYFEDGKMYYCANDCGNRGGKNGETCEGVSVAEADPDTGKVIGEIKRIWQGTGDGWLEGPHIYHIGEYYYLLAASGGTSAGHMSVLARSRELFGDYVSCPENPVLTNRNDTSKSIWCCGHSDLVEDGHGNYFFVHLGVRPFVSTKSNLGRETFLTPVVWRDDWFYADGKKATPNVCAPGNAVQRTDTEIKLDFKNPAWEPQWLFVKRRIDENYRRGDGRLTLFPSRDKLTDKNGFPTFAGIRQPDFVCEVSAELEFKFDKVGDEAGLCAYLSPEYMYKLCVRRESDGDYITVEKRADDFHELAYRERTTAGAIKLIIRADKEKYSFYTEQSGTQKFLCAASARFLTTELAGKCFTGTVTGAYAECCAETGAAAVFKTFDVKK